MNMSDEQAACWRKKRNRSSKASKMKRQKAKALERDHMIKVICIFSYFFFVETTVDLFVCILCLMFFFYCAVCLDVWS